VVTHTKGDVFIKNSIKINRTFALLGFIPTIEQAKLGKKMRGEFYHFLEVLLNKCPYFTKRK